MRFFESKEGNILSALFNSTTVAVCSTIISYNSFSHGNNWRGVMWGALAALMVATESSKKLSKVHDDQPSTEPQ